jgi:hypothetical protein
LVLTQVFKLERCDQFFPMEALVSDNAVHGWVFAVCVHHDCAGGITFFPISFKFMVGSTYVTI